MGLGRISQLVHVSIHQKVEIPLIGIQKLTGGRYNLDGQSWTDGGPLIWIPASIIEILVIASWLLNLPWANPAQSKNPLINFIFWILGL